uniref:Predicted protein n=1 Tax=Hordeum vulgare subsp. vulgare TaxID=112509 RepID=F2EJM6_HORVV|nr:predicted protein [Hordeum vulgare subsp. vulgare]
MGVEFELGIEAVVAAAAYVRAGKIPITSLCFILVSSSFGSCRRKRERAAAEREAFRFQQTVPPAPPCCCMTVP